MPKVDLEALRAISDKTERFVTAKEVFAQARIDAGNEIAAIIKENGKGSLQEAANIADYDVGGLYKRLTKGGFVLPPRKLVRLAYNYLHESCNMIYFGTKGVSALPRHESLLLSTFMQLDDAGKDSILIAAASMLEADIRQGTTAESLSDIEILKRRLGEISSDKFVRPSEVIGADVDQRIKMTLRKFTDDLLVETPTIKAIMYFALELRTTIDYLIAPDYSQYTDLRFYNKPDDDIITDKIALKVFSFYLKASDESKARLEALTFHFAMENGIRIEII